MTKQTTPEKTHRRRRADADRSVLAILEAAPDALASDPDASMAEIARRAGVVRATIYAHFPTRESLLDAVMEHAVAEVAEATAAAEPDRGEPEEALERVVRATWQKLDLFHALLAINTARLSVEELRRRHLPVVETVRATDRTRSEGRRLPSRCSSGVASRGAARNRARRKRGATERPAH